LRGNLTQPEMSKKLFKAIKTENAVISGIENTARDEYAFAQQLSEWGEETGDDAVSDLSDKLGVLLTEVAEVEENYASGLEDSRLILKQIRNMETSVAPARDHKLKISDQIYNLKHKDPNSPKIMVLEQELVRAEAEELVANAQLTNITRQKLKESFNAHFAIMTERAEKELILARNAKKLLELLDDTPIVPGDSATAYSYGPQAKQVLLDTEQELEAWQSAAHEEVPVNGSVGKEVEEED